MKKLLSISLVAVAAISALGYRNQVTPSAPSSLTMANIEALSQYEFIVGWDKGCLTQGDGCCTCPSCWYPDDRPVN